MNNSEPHVDKASSFYERYAGFSNQQIKEILKNHKDYQESALTAAVKIAIERELIHSEQDLLTPEYQSQMKDKWTAFPIAQNAYLYKRMLASIFRALFLTSLVPIVYGVMKYADGQLNITYLGIGLGLTWLVITFILLKTKKLIFLFLQMIMIIFVFFIVGYLLLSQKHIQKTDLVVLVGGTLVILYLLFFLKKLIQTKPTEQTGL